MGYLAGSAQQQSYQPAIDYFSGTGSTATFTLSRPVVSVAQMVVSVANVIQNPNTYSVNGNVLTLGGNAPAGTNNVWVQYITNIVQINQPGVGTVGNSQLQAGAALANIGAGGIGQSYLGTGVAGTGPAFSAYMNNAQGAVSAGATVKILFDTKEYDTNNNFTSSRFTPTVAGNYQFNATIRVDGSPSRVIVYLYKNGSIYKTGNDITPNPINLVVSTQAYANGTTDYFEIYAYVASAGTLTSTGTFNNYFNGALVRAA